MRTLAVKASTKPEFQQFARGFWKGNPLETVRALDNAVRRVYRYRDESVEMIRDPLLMMQDWQQRGYLEGDCDDISTFLAAIGKAMGFLVRYVAIRTNRDNPNYTHVFTEISLSGYWQRMDSTIQNTTNLPFYGLRMEQTV